MDRKALGVADAIADLAIADSELQDAAARLQRNRNKTTPQNNSTQKKPTKLTASSLQRVENPNTATTVEKPTKKKGDGQPKVQKKAKVRQWGNPTAILNTRIPPEMDCMLDDVLASKRRVWKEAGQQGTKPTKQTIIQDALELYFQKNKPS